MKISTSNEYGKLKSVIVGSVNNMSWPEDDEEFNRSIDRSTYPTTLTRGAIPDVVKQEATEDLERLVDILENRKIKVHRPITPRPHWAYSARDIILIVGNKVIECPTPFNSRAKELDLYPELKSASCDIIRAPRPATNEDPMFDAANVLKVNDKLLYSLSHSANSAGAVYSALYLERVKPLYDLHMGCENMAPHLYSMVRFLKVQNILEVGAGYTSIFLLQALHDNELEIENLAKLHRAGQCNVGKQPYCVGKKLEDIEKKKSTLHCVDHMGHEHTTANKVLEIAKDLNIDSHLQIHDIDFWEFDLQYEDEEEEIDFIWLDFAAGSKLNEVFDRWWDRLKNGGFMEFKKTQTLRALANHQHQKMPGKNQ